MSGNNSKVTTDRMYFLSPDEVMFFDALCDTVVPAGENEAKDPGAVTVGAISYIDSNLCDLPKESQDYFRSVISLVNEKSEHEYSKRFANLKPSERDSLLKEIYLDPHTREMLFDIRSLVLEGFYSDYRDPSYNGLTSWDVIGFSGKRISDLKKDWSFLRVWKEHSSFKKD